MWEGAVRGRKAGVWHAGFTSLDGVSCRGCRDVLGHSTYPREARYAVKLPDLPLLQLVTTVGRRPECFFGAELHQRFTLFIQNPFLSSNVYPCVLFLSAWKSIRP